MKPTREEIGQRCVAHLKENNHHEPSPLMSSITQEFYITGFEHGYDYKAQQPTFFWHGTEEDSKRLIELAEQQKQCQSLEVVHITPDPWRGPEERPEVEDFIKAYFLDGSGSKQEWPCVGTYQLMYDRGLIVSNTGDVGWCYILCWQPIEIGPMPERFKREGESGKYANKLYQDLMAMVEPLHTKGEVTISEDNAARTKELYVKLKGETTK